MIHVADEKKKDRERLDIQPIQNVMKQIDSFFHESRNRFKAFSLAKEFPVSSRETDSGFHITAELAGYGRDQIRLQVIGNQLHIIARNEEGEPSKRVITLPFLIAEKEIRATHRNGLLKITIPKKPIHKAQIDIE